MLSSQMNSLSVNVELTKAIYAPGDLVEGCINFNITHKLTCEFITARLIGVLRTKFTVGETVAYTPLSPRNPPRIFYRHEKVLIDRVYEVLRTNEVEAKRNSLDSLQLEAFCANLPFPINENQSDVRGVDEGKHQFPIRFFLPEFGLITSFSNPSSPTVVKARDISVNLTLTKNEFLPTEPFLCKISIANNWKHALKYLYLNIVQRIVSSGHLENFKDVKEEKVKEIEFNGVGFPESISKIEAGSNVTFSPPPYYIPALVPNINAYGLFLVEYYAQLKIGRSKSGILCSMRTPIKIGTHHENEAMRNTTEYTVCSREELSRSFHESPGNTNSFHGVDLLA
uniref:Arrestin C-terminal-like domain-containing protein n=1 Tax=Acrobeloides nanus TaxID=290746 RepID=A0A914BYC5_9BILA